MAEEIFSYEVYNIDLVVSFLFLLSCRKKENISERREMASETLYKQGQLHKSFLKLKYFCLVAERNFKAFCGQTNQEC